MRPDFSGHPWRRGRRLGLVTLLAVAGVLVNVLPAAAAGGTVWTTLTSMPTARQGLAAASAPCPMGEPGTCVYAIGGVDGGSGALDTVESYNPATETWTSLPPLHTPRAYLAAAAAPCPRGETGLCVYAIGGATTDRAVGAVESYNPATDAWTILPSLPTPRAGLAAAVAPCPSGQAGPCVYVLGGASQTVVSRDKPALRTVQSYNPVTNAWSTESPMQTPRAFLAAAAADCPSGQAGTCVYAIGGSTGSAFLDTVQAYDPTDNAWIAATPGPTARAETAAVSASCPAGQVGTCVYVLGGISGGADVLGTQESYSAAANDWTEMSPMPTPRLSLAAVTAPCPPGETGVCIYAVGGFDGTDAVGTMEAVDPPVRH